MTLSNGALSSTDSLTPTPPIRRAVGNDDIHSLGKRLVCPAQQQAHPAVCRVAK